MDPEVVDGLECAYELRYGEAAVISVLLTQFEPSIYHDEEASVRVHADSDFVYLECKPGSPQLNR